MKYELLKFAESNIAYIEGLSPYLSSRYASEASGIFKKYIFEKAASASSRNDYRAACKIIENYRKACGVESARVVRDELAEKYHRRPAFIDELKKLKL